MSEIFTDDRSKTNEGEKKYTTSLKYKMYENRSDLALYDTVIEIRFHQILKATRTFSEFHKTSSYRVIYQNLSYLFNLGFSNWNAMSLSTQLHWLYAPLLDIYLT